MAPAIAARAKDVTPRTSADQPRFVRKVTAEMAAKAKELYTAALAAERAGNFSGALKLYKAAARADVNFREAFLNLGALYSRAKRPDLAIGFFRRALELGTDDAVLFNLGSECFKLQRYEESEKYLKGALKLNLRLLKGHVLLAYLYEKAKRPEKSAIYFTNALRLDPASRAAALGLAISLSDQEKFEAALDVIEKYRSVTKSDDTLDNLRAGLLLKTKRYDDSLTEYRRLTQSAPGYVNFTEHLKQARDAQDVELFEGIDDKIRARTERLRKKMEERKARKAQTTAAPAAPAADLKQDLKDMMDLSFLHLFNGDPDKALRFLMQARKMKEKSGE